MKLCLFSVVLCLSFHAHAEFFGHWPGNEITFSGSSGNVGQFQFNVSNPTVSAFLLCAANPNSDDEVFLSGNGRTSTVTDAFICAGEVTLGQCSSPQYSCSPDTYLSRKCKAQALSFANAGLSIQEGTPIQGYIIKSWSARGEDAITETYIVEALSPDHQNILPHVQVTMIPEGAKCTPWSYSLPGVN